MQYLIGAGLAALLAAGLASPQQNKTATPSLADGKPDAVISFFSADPIEGWAYDPAHKAVYLKDARSKWYYATFIGGCPELGVATGFEVNTRGSNRLDRFASFVLDDDDNTVCMVDRLVEIDPPTDLKRLKRR